MPTLRQLSYLVAINDCLHFRHAAESCNVSQPTLSAQLGLLEDRLGVRLVERNKRHVAMTTAGKVLAARARLILRDVHDLVEMAKGDLTAAESGLGGVLRIGSLASIGPYLMRHVLPTLKETYPELTPYLREDPPFVLRNRLLEGELDLIVKPLPLGSDAFDTFDLYREPLWLALPGDHPFRGREDLCPEDIAGMDVLMLEKGHRLHDQVLDLCDRFGARPRFDFETTSLDTLRNMVAAGAGVTLLPALYVRSIVPRDDELVLLPFQPGGPERRIGLVWPRGASRSGTFKALGNLIRCQLAGLKGDGRHPDQANVTAWAPDPPARPAAENSPEKV
ncbi:MAG: LysR substrate-binding domain-containing protein [Magnetovibrionaceae bacterium]